MAAPDIQALKDRLHSLKGELINALDPARAKQLRDEIVKLAHDIRGNEAQAGKLKTRVEQVRGVILTIGAAASTAFNTLSSVIRSTVAVADPTAFWQFNQAIRDLAAVTGQLLAPALRQMTAAIRGVADWVLNLSPETKRLITTMVSFTLAITGVITAAFLLSKAIMAVSAAAAALNLSTGGLIGIFAAVAAVASSLVSAMSSAGDVGNVLSTVWDKVGSTLTAVWTALAPLVNLILDLTNAIVGGLLGALGDLVKVLGDLLLTITQLLSSVLGPLIEAVGSVLVAAFEAVVTVLRSVIWALQKAIDLMRYFLGLPPVKDPDSDKKKKRSSVGMAGVGASFISTEDVQKRAITAAFKAVGKSPEQIAFDQRKTIINHLKGIETNTQDLGGSEGGEGGGWGDDRGRW